MILTLFQPIKWEYLPVCSVSLVIFIYFWNRPIISKYIILGNQSTNQRWVFSLYMEYKPIISQCLPLAAVRQRMRKNGTIVTYLPVGLTPGICCSNPIPRKNMFAYLTNQNNYAVSTNQMRAFTVETVQTRTWGWMWEDCIFLLRSRCCWIFVPENNVWCKIVALALYKKLLIKSLMQWLLESDPNSIDIDCSDSVWSCEESIHFISSSSSRLWHITSHGPIYNNMFNVQCLSSLSTKPIFIVIRATLLIVTDDCGLSW